MIIRLQKFLHFSSFPFLIFFTTVWCKKWANPFGLDLRPALNHKPSVFSSRQELKGWLFKSHLMTQHYSIHNCIHTAISYNFIHYMIITFLLRYMCTCAKYLECSVSAQNQIKHIKTKRDCRHVLTLWTKMCLIPPENEGIDLKIVLKLHIASHCSMT